ncbi:hypothetical protein NBRC116493_08580 [Aurantivibrio infirmus]
MGEPQDGVSESSQIVAKRVDSTTGPAIAKEQDTKQGTLHVRLNGLHGQR